MTTAAAPTGEQLREALEAIRRRPYCRCWPDDVESVLADPQRAPLLRLVARHLGRRPRPIRPLPDRLRERPGFDIKRAAAGDRDDD